MAQWINIILTLDQPTSPERLAMINRRLSQEEIPQGAEQASIQLGDYDFTGLSNGENSQGIYQEWRSPLIEFPILQAILHSIGHPNHGATYQEEGPRPQLQASDPSLLTREHQVLVRQLFPESFAALDPFLIHIKPPQPLPARTENPVVFLAGTIDNGTGVEWQEELVAQLQETRITLLNPRRSSWDSSLKSAITEPVFKAQVEWEIAGMEMADHIFMYLAPGSKSPITLLELGLFAASKKLLVCCPKGFWRKGNVDVICARYQIPTTENLETALKQLQEWAQ